MSTREEILEVINEIIEENHGTAVTEDTIVKDFDIDSFGFAVFFLELDDRFGSFSETDKAASSFRDRTVAQIIDKIVECS